MNISTNISALTSNQSFLNTTAKNIQNSSGDLSKEIPNLIIAKETNELNVVTIKAQDEMLGSLLDIKA